MSSANESLRVRDLDAARPTLEALVRNTPVDGDNYDALMYVELFCNVHRAITQRVHDAIEERPLSVLRGEACVTEYVRGIASATKVNGLCARLLSALEQYTHIHRGVAWVASTELQIENAVASGVPQSIRDHASLLVFDDIDSVLAEAPDAVFVESRNPTTGAALSAPRERCAVCHVIREADATSYVLLRERVDGAAAAPPLVITAGAVCCDKIVTMHRVVHAAAQTQRTLDNLFSGGECDTWWYRFETHYDVSPERSRQFIDDCVSHLADDRAIELLRLDPSTAAPIARWRRDMYRDVVERLTSDEERAVGEYSADDNVAGSIDIADSAALSDDSDDDDSDSDEESFIADSDSDSDEMSDSESEASSDFEESDDDDDDDDSAPPPPPRKRRNVSNAR